MADSLKEHCVGHYPLSQIHFINTMFRELALLPSSDDWLSLY
jgi:hypothetical protein